MTTPKIHADIVDYTDNLQVCVFQNEIIPSDNDKTTQFQSLNPIHIF